MLGFSPQLLPFNFCINFYELLCLWLWSARCVANIAQYVAGRLMCLYRWSHVCKVGSCKQWFAGQSHDHGAQSPSFSDTFPRNRCYSALSKYHLHSLWSVQRLAKVPHNSRKSAKFASSQAYFERPLWSSLAQTQPGAQRRVNNTPELSVWLCVGT